MAPKTKVLFYFYHEFVPGEIWVDEHGEMVAVIHENDGSWRRSLDFVARHFGGRVVELDGYDILDDDEEDGSVCGLTSEEMSELDFEDTAKLIVERNKAAILAAMEACDG